MSTRDGVVRRRVRALIQAVRTAIRNAYARTHGVAEKVAGRLTYALEGMKEEGGVSGVRRASVVRAQPRCLCQVNDCGVSYMLSVRADVPAYVLMHSCMTRAP